MWLTGERQKEREKEEQKGQDFGCERHLSLLHKVLLGLLQLHKCIYTNLDPYIIWLKSWNLV